MGSLRDRREIRLLAAAQRGDRRAFRRLYTRLYDDVRRYVSRRVPLDEVDDVVSQTFEQMLRRLDQFDAERGTARMWVFGIARHAVVDVHRASRRRPSSDVDQAERATSVWAASDDPLGRLIADERHAEVVAAIRRLDEDARRLLVLRYGDGLAHREIAALVDSSEQTVRKRLSRIRQSLRDALAEPKGAAEHVSRPH